MKSIVKSLTKLALPAAALMLAGALAPQALYAGGNSSGAPVPPVPKFSTESNEARGLEIAQYMDLFDTGWKDQYSTSRMTLYDARGDSVQRSVVQMTLERPEGDKSIVKFRSPAEIKGVAALTHEHPDATDDNWLYLPASKRVRRISGANKTASFQGTEFTYEDLSSLIIAKYDWRFLVEDELKSDGAEQPVYKLEARPNYRNTGYSRLVVYVNRDLWRIERIDFYDKAGRLLKVLENSDWTQLHGRFWRAQRLEMKNVQTKKRTVIEVKNLLVNLGLYRSPKSGKQRSNLTDRHFTTRSLEGR